MPDLAYQVDFPRLEIVLEGEFVDTGAGATLVPGDVLYVPAGGWNFPQWQAPATTFSVLFGKQQLGFSVVQWDGKQYQNLAKQHVAQSWPTHRFFCYKRSMKCKCSRRSSKRQGLSSPACLATAAICLAAKSRPPHAARHYSKLFAIISTNAMPPRLPANPVAQAFYISPNYLSHLFQKTGAIGFNEYLNHTRLEHAKTLLKGYDLKVKEVAHACGFVDSNYFCRLFRKNTDARRRNIAGSTTAN